MWKEFRAFIFKGNVVDLAVAVVIGAAFGAVITSLTKDILTPLIAAIVGRPDFSRFHLVLNHSNITYGVFINSLVAFILIAAAVYFFVVAPVNTMLRRLHGPAADTPPKTKKCPECLSDIPLEARRCAHCAQPVASGGL